MKYFKNYWTTTITLVTPDLKSIFEEFLISSDLLWSFWGLFEVVTPPICLQLFALTLLTVASLTLVHSFQCQKNEKKRFSSKLLAHSNWNF